MPWPSQFSSGSSQSSSGSSQSSSGSSQSSSGSSQSSASSRYTTSSYWSFNGQSCDSNDPNSKKFIKNSDVKAQQASMPANLAPRGYPSRYGNSEQLQLSTPGSILQAGRGTQWMHAPVMPDTTQAYTHGKPGAVRGVWTAGDSNTYDVMYHDKSAGTSASGHGAFRLANYHPAATTSSSNGLASSTNYNSPAASANYNNLASSTNYNGLAASANYPNNPATSTNYNSLATSANYSNNPTYDQSSSSGSYSQGYSHQYWSE